MGFISFFRYLDIFLFGKKEIFKDTQGMADAENLSEVKRHLFAGSGESHIFLESRFLYYSC